MAYLFGIIQLSALKKKIQVFHWGKVEWLKHEYFNLMSLWDCAHCWRLLPEGDGEDLFSFLGGFLTTSLPLGHCECLWSILENSLGLAPVVCALWGLLLCLPVLGQWPLLLWVTYSSCVTDTLTLYCWIAPMYLQQFLCAWHCAWVFEQFPTS